MTSVYLIEYDDEVERPLKRHWKWMFERKLNSWWREPKQWPRKRSYSMFREWFVVRIVDLVLDLVDGSLYHDDEL
ncbi:hypothetical protein [Rubinisphaera sp.]|uniref:hypothetical protein n=1 Tax=Rubinisphaera sp. TaxID=2024857 RepID=UPI000C0D97A8|nr:hypothetical protein [Rubinisphaera sp.]MBV07727.1 hypothetical protein [Rubinisphaera sp.]HCS52864.1 hypothetical protein [Planctomycetaceae bacterium]